MEAHVASRVTRWSVVTALALVGALVVTLPPGPSPFEVLWPGWDRRERAPIDEALSSTETALAWARGALSAAEARQELLGGSLLRRSPLVVRIDGGRVTVDEALTRRAGSYWRTAGIGREAPRSLLVVENGAASRRFEPIAGVCVTRLTRGSTWGRRDEVMASAGRCYFEARFGPPGPLVRAWVDSAYQLVIPGGARRVPVGLQVHSDAGQWPEWAFDGVPGAASWSGWFRSREELACAKGRSDFCVAAIGLPAWSSDGRIRSYTQRRTIGELPAALLEELGPDRFGELWRSDATIPESFERLTGAPFEPWAMEFVQRRVGRVERPTALGSGGWLGWLFWTGVFLGWTVTRLRSSPAR
jgi:hypothetical protein